MNSSLSTINDSSSVNNTNTKFAETRQIYYLLLNPDESHFVLFLPDGFNYEEDFLEKGKMKKNPIKIYLKLFNKIQK